VALLDLVEWYEIEVKFDVTHLSVRTPPIVGPTMLAIANTPPKEPNSRGRCSRRVRRDKRVRIEMKMPDAPIP
jgi:hypothetical protein